MSEKENDQIPLIKDTNGLPELYSNLVNVNWTLYDVRLRFIQMVANPTDALDKVGWAALEKGNVAIPWGQAKILRDMLTEVIKRYEDVNGEIADTKLPT